MILGPGQRLSHYRLAEKIGEGGMGVVYRAWDERLERDVAVKVLPAGALAGEAARRRFRKEALALSKLNHPNIETVYEFDIQDGVDFLVMEHIAGETLNAKLAAGLLPEKEVVRLGMQLAEGLAAAHEKGVIHRDLKPGNLRLTPDSRLKILDFGLAKLLRPVTEAATTESLTMTQAVAGTLPYMAPEQLRGEPVDARSDIYAAGVVLYEMATGRLPFQEKLSTALVDDILHKTPPPPGRLTLDLSSQLEALVLKCLEKDPEHRFQSARELLADLRRLTPAAATPPAPRPQPAWGKSRRWAAALALLALPGLVVVLLALNVAGLRDRLFGGAAAARVESLAVLPLQNLSGDPKQDYFVEGMHEALITELSKIGALRVISRTSAMRYKDTDKPLAEIARELKVDAVVEGSVLRAGNRVRVTAQLIAPSPERHLWADNFDRELSDVLVLTSEVARAVANEVKVKVTPQEQVRLARTRPVNPEAYEVYLRGRYHFNQQTQEGARKAIEYFHQAIEKDPSYALGYTGLADAYAEFSSFYFPPGEGMPKAAAAARKALELDDTLAEAHSSLGVVMFWYDWDWAGAERELRRALELNPNSSIARRYYAWYLALTGRLDESLAEMKRAQQLDPLSPLIAVDVTIPLYLGRQYNQSIPQVRRALEMDPNFFLPHFVLAEHYGQKREFAEAIAELQKARQLENEPWMIGALGYGYARAGHKAEAQKILQELKELSRQKYVSPYSIAYLYVGLGEKDRAFEWLEKAYAERSSFMTWIKMEPKLDPLRADPRFQDLLRRMKFPPQ